MLNNRIFDFSRYGLRERNLSEDEWDDLTPWTVEEEGEDEFSETGNDLFEDMKDTLLSGPEVVRYMVDIREFTNGSRVGFNHASCQCYTEAKRVDEVVHEQTFLLDNVVVLLQFEPDKVQVQTIYGGIVAL